MSFSSKELWSDMIAEALKPTRDYNLFHGGGPSYTEWPHATREGDPRFIALLDEIEGIHAAKQRDYGTAADPFANVRASEELGIPGWIGGLIRMNDKIRRLNKAARQVIAGEPVNMAFDGPLDDLKDLAVYSLIGVVLYEEQEKI